MYLFTYSIRQTSRNVSVAYLTDLSVGLIERYRTDKIEDTIQQLDH